MSMDVVRIFAVIGIVHLAWDALVVGWIVWWYAHAVEETYPGEYGE